MPPPEMVNNWRLLELNIIAALIAEHKHVAKNAVGEPCAVHVNIAKLAQALSRRGVLVAGAVSAKDAT